MILAGSFFMPTLCKDSAADRTGFTPGMNGSLLRDGINQPTGYGRNQATSNTTLLLFSEFRFPFLKIPSATAAVFFSFFFFLFFIFFSFIFSSLGLCFFFGGGTPCQKAFQKFFLTQKEAYFSTSFL